MVRHGVARLGPGDRRPGDRLRPRGTTRMAAGQGRSERMTRRPPRSHELGHPRERGRSARKDAASRTPPAARAPTPAAASSAPRPAAPASSSVRGTHPAVRRRTRSLVSRACWPSGMRRGEDPRVVAARLEGRGDPVPPPAQVRRRRPAPRTPPRPRARRPQRTAPPRSGATPSAPASSRDARRPAVQGVVGGSTPPPGKTTIDGANAIVGDPALDEHLRPVAPSRTSMTVAAARGAATRRRPPASHARGPRSSRPVVARLAAAARPTAASVADVDDDLDLDRRVERQHRDADGRAGVDAGVAEGLCRTARWRR